MAELAARILASTILVVALIGVASSVPAGHTSQPLPGVSTNR